VTHCVDEYWMGDDGASQDAIGGSFSKSAGSPTSAARSGALALVLVSTLWRTAACSTDLRGLQCPSRGMTAWGGSTPLDRF
jgi:hypothetical protein